MISPKRFDVSPLTGGCSKGLDAFRCFFEQRRQPARPKVKGILYINSLEQLKVPVEPNEKIEVGWLGMYSNCCGQTTSGLPPDQPPVSWYLIHATAVHRPRQHTQRARRYTVHCNKNALNGKDKTSRKLFFVHAEYLVTVDMTLHVGTIPTWLASYFLV